MGRDELKDSVTGMMNLVNDDEIWTQASTSGIKDSVCKVHYQERE
jgi:hypothetical protein